MNNKAKQYITVPNLFTTLNLFCGFASVTATMSGKYAAAGWIIFMAGIFDALDGRIARASGQSSEFGLQMDSFADVIAGGMAPSILLYQYYLKDVGNHAVIGLLLGFLPLLFATFRLARFNVMTSLEGRKPYYTGMPAPMAATTLASLVIMHSYVGWPFLLRLMLVMTPMVGLAMASQMHYESFPRFNIRQRGGNRFKLFMFFAGLVNVFIFPEFTLFIFMMIYFLSGPLVFLYTLATSSHHSDSPLDDEELAADSHLQ
jgi:CDP-diacylglycerol--serine O-phosphatidyltransferase